MKKTLAICLIFLFAFTLGLSVSFAYAEAEPDIRVAIEAERILPERYYEFQNLARLTVALDGTVAAIESVGGEKWLRVAGATARERLLLSPESSVTKLSIYGNYIIGNFGLGYLSAYSISEDAFNITGVLATQALYDIAVSESENRLYLLTNSGLIWYGLSAGVGLNIAPGGEYAFPLDENFVNPNRLAATEGKVFMYNTNASKVYSYAVGGDICEEYSGLVADGSVETLFCPDPEGFILVKGDGIYLNGYNNKVIAVSESAIDALPVSISGAVVQNGYIYIVDNAYKAVKMFNVADCTFAGYYGSYGEGAARLNSPSGVAYTKEGLYIADGGNNRIVGYTESNNAFNAEVFYGSTPASPKLLAASSEGVYAGKGDNHLFYYENNTYVKTYSFDEAVTSVTVLSNDTVYVASGSKIFIMLPDDGAFSEYIAADSEVLLVAGGLYGKILYALIGDAIYCYYSSDVRYSQKIALSEYAIEPSAVTAICPDYDGNVFIVIENLVIRFEREAESYVYAAEFEVKTLGAIGGAALSCEGGMYITSGHSLLVLNGLGAVTAQGSIFENPQEIEFPIRIAYGKGFLQSAPNNFEDVVYVGEEEYLMVFSAAVVYKQVEYYFVEHEGRRMYIPKANCSLAEGEALEDTYVTCLYDTVNIYQYPSATSPKIAKGLTREDIIEVISYVAGSAEEDIWGWYRVAYEGSYGYVQISSVLTAERPYIPVTRYYVKAKSAHFGAAIKVYSAPSVESEVIASITDGARVELTAPYDKASSFSEIRINGTLGYIATDNLMQKGLTNGQILALALSIVTVAASVVTVLLFKLFKRKG